MRTNKGKGKPNKTGSFDGHGATISTIPEGARGVWPVDERGRSIKPRRRRGRQGIKRKASTGRPAAAELPPTPKQLEVWQALDPMEPRTPKQIADAIGVGAHVVASHLYALKQKGLADRADEAWSRHGWLQRGEAA